MVAVSCWKGHDWRTVPTGGGQLRCERCGALLSSGLTDSLERMRLEVDRAVLRDAVRDMLGTRAAMMRVGLALAALAPDDEQMAAALEAEGEAVKRLTDALERISARLNGPPPPAGAS